MASSAAAAQPTSCDATQYNSCPYCFCQITTSGQPICSDEERCSNSASVSNPVCQTDADCVPQNGANFVCAYDDQNFCPGGRICAHLGDANTCGDTPSSVLGGLVGIAVSQAILSDHVGSDLASILSPDQLAALYRSVDSIRDFSVEQAAAIRESYGRGFNLQFRVMMYFAIGCLLVTLGCWIRNPMDVQAREKVEEENRKRRIEQENVEENLENGQ